MADLVAWGSKPQATSRKPHKMGLSTGDSLVLSPVQGASVGVAWGFEPQAARVRRIKEEARWPSTTE
jgi:hypothetical protein